MNLRIPVKLLLALCLLLSAATFATAQTAAAGADRTAFVNETLSLDGSASTGGFDGVQSDGRHSYRWDFGYGGWTYEGGLIAPIAYPTVGAYTVTLTVCASGGACASDTATVTVTAIPLGSVTTLTDTGNSLTNLTNLQAQIDGRLTEASPVTNLPSGFVWRGTLVLKHRTSATYHTIRTANHASLPVGTSRVVPADATNMAVAEIAISGNIIETPVTSSTPARYFNFVGIHLRKAVSTFDYTHSFVQLGQGDETALTQLVNHVIFDRCYFDGGSTTSKTLRGINIRASDSSLVNSYLWRFKGFQLETQAALTLLGERQAFINNFMEGASENYMSGGALSTIIVTTDNAQGTGNDSTHIKLAAGASAVNNFYTGMGVYIVSGTGSGQGRTITAYDGTTKIATVTPAWTTIPSGTSAYRIGEHVPTDVVFRRNHLKKDTCWLLGQGCYYGVDISVKNNFEIKIGRRFSVQGNFLENHWQEDQNFMVAITVRGQDPGAPWSNISYLDFSHNKLHKMGRGVNTLTKDDLTDSGLANHILYRHNIFSGVSFFNGIFQTWFFSGAGSGDRLMLIRNTTDQNGDPSAGQGRWIGWEDATGNTNCIVLGNVGQGFIHHNLGNGTAAFQTACSTTSFDVRKNGFYRGSGTNPADNSSVSLIADVKFTNLAGFNLKLAGDSPWLTTGIGGGRAGADTDTVDTLTSGTVTGVWPSTSIIVCKWSNPGAPCQE